MAACRPRPSQFLSEMSFRPLISYRTVRSIRIPFAEHRLLGQRRAVSPAYPDPDARGQPSQVTK